MEASFFLSPLRDGRCGPMRGALPLGSRSADLAPTPRSGGAAPPRPHREGAPPHTPGVYAGLAAPAPTMRALRPAPRGFLRGWQPQHPPAGAPPCTRVTFPSRGKSPKARQGLRPLESPGAWPPPFSRSLRCAPSRAGLPSATNPDRFATLN